MAVHTYRAYHFHEFMEIVESIGTSGQMALNNPPVLWSRGHRKTDWNLLPTLIRDVNLDVLSGIPHASKRAVEEELRKEHYIAKNYHFFEKEPGTSLAWMEIMQHHGVKTRLLDWSESIMHSLLFSLECFFDNEKYRDDDRINSSPCVWILEPSKWNKVALKLLLGNPAILNLCLDALPISNPIIGMQARKNVRRRYMQLNQNFDRYMNTDSTRHLQGIFNLSSMMSELQALQSEDLLYLLEEGELFYCLAYTLLRVYMDSGLRKPEEVLPLSIVESYHSERIRAQRGAFTIFPYYEETSNYAAAKHRKIPLDAMEYMSQGNGFLHKIRLCNPDEIAFEVMNAGLNISWLYPEMPVVANSIEHRTIYI